MYAGSRYGGGKGWEGVGRVLFLDEREWAGLQRGYGMGKGVKPEDEGRY
jgi:hypothetical protein